jgi:hypothetical protein
MPKNGLQMAKKTASDTLLDIIKPVITYVCQIMLMKKAQKTTGPIAIKNAFTVSRICAIIAYSIFSGPAFCSLPEIELVHEGRDRPGTHPTSAISNGFMSERRTPVALGLSGASPEYLKIG